MHIAYWHEDIHKPNVKYNEFYLMKGKTSKKKKFREHHSANCMASVCFSHIVVQIVPDFG